MMPVFPPAPPGCGGRADGHHHGAGADPRMATGISINFREMAVSLVSETSQYWKSMSIVVIFGLAGHSADPGGGAHPLFPVYRSPGIHKIKICDGQKMVLAAISKSEG
ncbi:MAG: hypothetical protein R2860_01885 [Desulfobacterales bacterium]